MGAYREKVWRERERDRERDIREREWRQIVVVRGTATHRGRKEVKVKSCEQRMLEQREIAAWEKKKERWNDGIKKEIKTQSRLLCFFSHLCIPKVFYIPCPSLYSLWWCGVTPGVQIG